MLSMVPTQRTLDPVIFTENDHKCERKWKLNGIAYEGCSETPENQVCLCAIKVDRRGELEEWDQCDPVLCEEN